ncbi:MAG: adenosylcobinamide-phosphate synthase CbiB [Pseudomonadota bacterium]
MASLLAIAMVLDAILGEPDWLWSRVRHPAVLMGQVVSVLDKRLNTGETQRLNGVLAVLLMIVAAGVAGWALAQLGWIVEVICAAVLLAQKSLVAHVAAVAHGLRTSLQDGRKAVALIVSRDTGMMDESAVARSAIESAAENLSDGVIAPAFWFLVAGLPGIALYKMVNTADSMIGYRTERYVRFGTAAARADDVLNWIPARLTALMIVLLNGHWRAWPEIKADASRHKSPNAGWPEAAMAGALCISLAGPRTYDGIAQQFPWVNEHGRKKLIPHDIDRCVGMLWKVWALAFSVVLLLSFFMG